MNDTIRETSRDVAEKMLDCCNLDNGYRVLEPSAGKGVLAEHIRHHCLVNGISVNLECVELNEGNRGILKDKGFTIVGRDFLNFNPSHSYRSVIACPNFQGEVDRSHVRKMYKVTAEHGKVVSLMCPSWMVDNTESAKDFRQWILGKNYYVKMLPDNSYRENGENRSTAIVVINK